MRDARTVKLAYRPVGAEALEQFVKLRERELSGHGAAEALAGFELPAEEAARIRAAVDSFCRPRVVKSALARAAPKSAERRAKQQQQLAEPVNDADFLELYGAETLELMKVWEVRLLALREKSERLITPRQEP